MPLYHDLFGVAWATYAVNVLSLQVLSVSSVGYMESIGYEKRTTSEKVEADRAKAGLKR